MSKMDTRFTLHFIVEKEGQLLREALTEWRISKRALTAIKFDGGLLTVNDVERNVRHPLRVGDRVEVKFPPEEKSEGLAVEHGELSIVYEDEAILVLNKPANQSTIPSREHPTYSIANLVCGHFQQQGLASTAHIVTRLDRDTSGLLCIAKHAHIHHLTGLAQRSGRFLDNMKQLYMDMWHKMYNQLLLQLVARRRVSLSERYVRTVNMRIQT
jgi:23S rRNA pseudouridine1911/1915/1917 synthase